MEDNWFKVGYEKEKADKSIEISSELSSQAITKTDDSKSFEEKSDKKKNQQYECFCFCFIFDDGCNKSVGF